MWQWMRATDYQHLPDPGGLLDQDHRLMANIAMIAEQYEISKQHIKANRADPAGDTSIEEMLGRNNTDG